MNLNENLQLTNNAVEYVLQRELTAHARAVNLLRRQSNVSVYLGVYAKGDGVTDDSAAINFVVQNLGGGVIDGGGLTYKCNSPITGITSGTTIQNATFDFSDMPAQAGQDKCITAAGTKGADVALTSNLTAGAVSVAVGDTDTFVAEQWVWLESTAVWSTSEGVVYGQFCKVKSVDSGTALTLYTGPIVNFNTADSATIAPVTPVERVWFKNVKIIGAGANSQAGLWFEYATDSGDEALVTEDVDYTGVIWFRCVNMRGSGTFKRARAVGLSYGYGITSGTMASKVVGCYGEDTRHVVTIGGTGGINIGNSVSDSKALGCRDAGFDSHAASYGTHFSNLYIEGAGTSVDGVVMQGIEFSIENIECRGIDRHGVLCQQNVNVTGGGVVRGVRGDVGAAVVSVEANDGDIDRISVSDVYGDGDTYMVIVQANAGRTISRAFVDRAVSTSPLASRGVRYLATGASAVIDGGAVTNCDLEIDTGGAEAIYLQSSTGVVRNVHVSGNRTRGAGTGMRWLGAQNVITDGTNKFGNTTPVNLDSTSTGSWVREDRNPTTVTASTYTVLPGDTDIIANRAGTVTVTLPTASDCPGRPIRFKTIQAQQVDSASSNVVPIDSATAGTAILPATDGAWAQLKSDGSNWIVMAKG